MFRFTAAILLVVQLLSTVTSHSVLNIQSREGQFPYPIIGSDEPADTATLGTFLNHMSINTRNLTASVKFYSEVLGFRKLFTLQISKTYSITYLAHAHGGRNGTGYQTVLEMNREKNNAQGLLEIVYVDIPINKSEFSAPHVNKFGHLGIVVPDTPTFQERLDRMPDVSVLKRYGEAFTELGTDLAVGPAVGLPSAMVEKLDEEEREAIVRGFGESVVPLIFITDPDGNFIEVQPQEGASLIG
ncbi:hypothetical protein ACLX1H_004118 [Fusarium chlamydosporum]